MKHVILLVCALLISGGLSISSQAEVVSKMVGASADCNGCITQPLTPAILCQAPSFCARIIAPDWSNTDIYYGTDGTNCRKSTDGAVTWANCTANPSTPVYSHYAVTLNGTVLAIGNDNGGTETRVRRSTNGAVSWSTVYSAAPANANTYSPNGQFRCAATADLCTFVYRDPSNNMVSLRSTDDGLTWVVNSAIGTTLNVTMAMVMANDGLLGIAVPPNADGASNLRSLLWDGVQWTRSAVVWPTSSGGQCNWAFIIGDSRKGICHVGTTGAAYTIRDINGNIEKTFTLPDVPSDNGGSAIGLAISLTSTGIWLFRTDTAGSTGIWVSLDSGTSFVKLTTIDPPGSGIGNQGSIHHVGGCLVASYNTTAGSTVVSVC